MAPSSADEPTGGGPDPGDPPGEKKIFVKSDESWKAEAQKEKERLQAKAAEEREKAGDLPPASFLALVSDLGLQAMLALGLAKVRGTEAPKRDLPAARYTIDLLGILEEKTRGNLSEEERDHLRELLTNLRLGFAQMAKKEESKTST
jgi:hypothetical protein